jgi:hypothetical protein
LRSRLLLEGDACNIAFILILWGDLVSQNNPWQACNFQGFFYVWTKDNIYL